MIEKIVKTLGPVLPILGTAAVMYVGIQFALKYMPKFSIPFLNGGGSVNIPLPVPSPMPGTDNPPAPVTNGDEFNDVSDDYLFGDLLSI